MTDIRFSVPAPPVLAVVALGAAALAWRRLSGLPPASRRVVTAACALYAAALVGATLLPLDVVIGRYASQSPWTSTLDLVPLVTADARSFTLNVVLFLPLGVLLGPLRLATSVRTAALVAVAVSLGIELLQLACTVLLGNGRSTDVNDLIANGLGGALGYAALRTAVRVPAAAPLVGRLGGAAALGVGRAR
ncbi:VanZ family protein [Patulibacter sp. SYSU D01012]|uniref:VanZ family protein n=1 Tax=Patulibacter sp. SYSU D01012 TaxID=2817381 RepID=UPI001B30CA58|nr:VanZ family protein [Patulibacter sp. SYSU D01012]